MKVLLFMMFLGMSQIVQGAEICKHGKPLTPELKRAYAQLKEIAEGIEGMEIRIKCLHKVDSDWTLKKEGEE